MKNHGAVLESAVAQGQLRRTKLCLHWMKEGCCLRGPQCDFAHGPQELMNAPDFRKTAMCHAFVETGECTREACPFAHGRAEKKRLGTVLNTCKSGTSQTGSIKSQVSTADDFDAYLEKFDSYKSSDGGWTSKTGSMRSHLLPSASNFDSEPAARRSPLPPSASNFNSDPCHSSQGTLQRGGAQSSGAQRGGAHSSGAASREDLLSQLQDLVQRPARQPRQLQLPQRACEEGWQPLLDEWQRQPQQPQPQQPQRQQQRPQQQQQPQPPPQPQVQHHVQELLCSMLQKELRQKELLLSMQCPTLEKLPERRPTETGLAAGATRLAWQEPQQQLQQAVAPLSVSARVSQANQANHMPNMMGMAGPDARRPCLGVPPVRGACQASSSSWVPTWPTCVVSDGGQVDVLGDLCSLARVHPKEMERVLQSAMSAAATYSD